MSARDLARFALLYLHEGNWAGTQVVPAEWVRQSTQPYSSSGFGPGYGFLWWTGTSDDMPAGSLRLPKGSFFALGAGGQYAFVIPSHDLVVVNRVDRDRNLPEPRMAAVAMLLDMILDAGGFRIEVDDPFAGPCTRASNPDIEWLWSTEHATLESPRRTTGTEGLTRSRRKLAGRHADRFGHRHHGHPGGAAGRQRGDP